jgi:hypothetical protein
MLGGTGELRGGQQDAPRLTLISVAYEEMCRKSHGHVKPEKTLPMSLPGAFILPVSRSQATVPLMIEDRAILVRLDG